MLLTRVMELTYAMCRSQQPRLLVINILRFERRVETRQLGVEPGKPRLTPTVLCPANACYCNTKVNMWQTGRSG